MADDENQEGRCVGARGGVCDGGSGSYRGEASRGWACLAEAGRGWGAYQILLGV